jgi:PucR-like helix-turn-helix protein
MSPVIADRPWEALPDAVGPVLRDELAPLSDEIIAAIREGVPEYAQPLEGSFGRTVQLGVDEALRQFVALIEDPAGGRGGGHEVYVSLGRGEMRAGRSLDSLLSAYRLGARVAWRRFAAAGERAGLSPRTLYLLAESIFAYIDELSADSIEGYAREQAAAAGAHQRRRRQLVRLLLEDPPPAAAGVEAAAADAGWELPRSLAVLAVEGEETDRVATRVGPDILVAPLPPGTVLVVPDPAAPGRRRELEAALRGRRGALGPAVTWPEARISFARARKLLTLVQDGALDAGSGLILADEHGLALLLGGDRRLALDLAARTLRPLVDETDRSRARLIETLAAWLRLRGRTEEVARSLHVHPQTVRYRLGRLRDLFGDRLEDPDARFELEVALRIAPPPTTTRTARRG